MEPNVAPKRSILLGFLSYEPDKNKENTHVCKFDQCGKSFDRQDRALGHIRMHLNHRPYHCNGQCHVSGWYIIYMKWSHSFLFSWTVRTAFLLARTFKATSNERKGIVRHGGPDILHIISGYWVDLACSGRSICRQNLRRHQASCSSSSTSSSKLTKRPKH